MNFTELKEERLQLLEQVNVLTESNCKGCKVNAKSKSDGRLCRSSNCSIVDDFRNIGLELEVNLANIRALRDEKHIQKREVVVAVKKPESKLNHKVKQDGVNEKAENELSLDMYEAFNAESKPKVKRKEVSNVAKIELTLDMYNSFKAEGKTDKEVMEITGMNNVTLNNFKREHDLIGKHKPGPVPKATPAQKYVAATAQKENSVEPANTDNDRITTLEKEVAEYKAMLNKAIESLESLKAENATLNQQIWSNRLESLYAKQAELENFIAEKHGISIQDYLDEQQLAILVEVAESANEWQGFKYWKQNKAIDRDKLLEETVDVLHLLLARGLAKGWQNTNLQSFKASTITNQYLYLLQWVATIAETQETYTKAFITYVGLTEMLGFTWSEIETAYLKKHQENIDRQNNNY